MKKVLLQALAALALTACVGAPQAGGLVDVSVVDRNTGESLKIYRHQGRLYVAGRPGNRYGITLQNKTPARTLSVLSVDGVNAVSGETAAVQQTGYVLDGGQSAQITGWRKSMSEVAAFVFTALPDSYAARTGRPDNVGVIGVAVFREFVAPPPEPLMAPSASEAREEAGSRGAASADMARAKQAERLGTGHGQRETSVVSYTDFQRASERPAEVIQIYYDSYANLAARGIIPAAKPARWPNAFPGEFVPDPA